VDEHTFKQRIVGAIVLVALAIIFIPMLLPGHRNSGFIDADSTIPPRPDKLENIRVLEMESPVTPPPPQQAVRTPVDEKTPALPEPPTESVPAEKPNPAPATPVVAPTKTVTPQTAPKAWAVQVGSFSQKANAMQLRDKLRGKGFKAFVEHIQLASGAAYRVRIGPYVKRSQAEKTQEAVAGKMKLKGIVVEHP
jgi:DedD protein